MQDMVELYLNSNLISHFKKLGHELPYHIDERGRKVHKNEKYIANVIDLPRKSRKIMISVMCDYCGEIHNKTVYDYFEGHKIIDKDACEKCKSKKQQDVYLFKYGTTSIKVRSEIEGFKLGRNKHSGDIVYNTFLEKGVIPQFRPEDYYSSTQDLPYICTRHLEYGILYRSYDTIRNIECACKYCNIEKGREYTRYSYDFVKEKFEEKQYKLVSVDYKDVDSDLLFICERHPEEGVQTTTFYSVLNYTNNCKRCRYDMQSGEFHYNWQGGISSERDKYKISVDYQRWRDNVFKRDNYTCQCCGKTNTYIEAHHLWNYADYPELRTNITNGITLCFDCHSVNAKGSFHNLYTQFHNTPDQLNEYIKRYQMGEFDIYRSPISKIAQEI